MLFTKKNKDDKYFFDVILGEPNKDDYVYAMAEAHAIDLIAKAISKCEVQIFGKNKKTKKIEKMRDEVYWALNIRPNHFENGTNFLYKLVVKLLTEKKALVLINRNPRGDPLLYVADDYTPSSNILYGKVFKDVSISDNEGNSIKMIKPYNEENSIYYSITNDRLKTASNNFKVNTAKILDAAVKSYTKANTPKWRLKSPGGQPPITDYETGKQMNYKEYIEKLTNGLTSEGESIFLLSEMFDLINMNKDVGTKSLEDIPKGLKMITDTVANNWNIPLDIFYGSKTEKSTGTNDFITFAVDPYFELLEDGFNIGLIGRDDYIAGEYAQFNKFNIAHKDIIESANGIDKLMSDGFSRNEINELLGLPKIDEAWADKHYVTKNYANVEGGVEENGA